MRSEAFSNAESSDSEHSNHSDDSSWEHSIEDQAKRDTRKQPWKKTFGDKVDDAFDEYAAASMDKIGASNGSRGLVKKRQSLLSWNQMCRLQVGLQFW
jgi:hypothetical protein